MNSYFYGLIESDKNKSFGSIGFEVGEKERGTVTAHSIPSAVLGPHQYLAAVIGPSPLEHFEKLPKETLVKALLAHQETLETIMRSQFILPCKFGTVIRGRQEADETISQNKELLTECFGQMKNRCELDIVATWNLHQMLNGIAQKDPEIEQHKRILDQFPSDKQEKVSLGMLLSKKLKEMKDQYASVIFNALKGSGEKWVEHNLMNDEMIFNASFLLPRREEEKFFKILDGLDKHFEGKLNFKCVGPLPPYSFATVNIRRFDIKVIQQAKMILGLGPFFNLEEVKRVYKKGARKCHPDTHPKADGKKFESLQQAYALLTAYCQGGCKPIRVSLSSVSGETL